MIMSVRAVILRKGAFLKDVTVFVDKWCPYGPSSFLGPSRVWPFQQRQCALPVFILQHRLFEELKVVLC